MRLGPAAGPEARKRKSVETAVSAQERWNRLAEQPLISAAPLGLAQPSMPQEQVLFSRPQTPVAQLPGLRLSEGLWRLRLRSPALTERPPTFVPQALTERPPTFVPQVPTERPPTFVAQAVPAAPPFRCF